ncbi:MAG: Trigger factor [Candidatus Uhrbacteria bacterium GW2011_GWE2_40_58]|nr:MAG: Trigger factor [Candidatus Uhrbacteria bacterium GW2011_GWF2_40_263]KKR66690.1 MAG: Trigger factor [Candidatus Uhrbacteria bacterium GW2011_GWE2_40_58]OGL92181.1 MAG: trigger factor [Candidatus Uhrbacteria bacterium RIFOXYA2_FULL_40_9]OGL96690.1 MAG: trigger factor [Candidatus Uhrbacteria bacterium RIFOXYB2_FULL_41_18]HCB56356.1 trigger factor [Candidatus Uhrbacteria bacterium]
MPNISVETLEKNAVKITVTIPVEEVQPYLEEAAQRISQQTTIPGFRPGKASYEVVKQRVGEMKIYEEALEVIVRKTYVETLLSEKIETVGSPKIDVEKLAPGNPIIYTAEVARMPSVLELADFRSLKISPNEVKAEESEVEQTIRDLARMQTKEVRATASEPAKKEDKIVVSMEMNKEGVAIEGGTSPNHAIYLAEDYYIPGLKEQVIGMKEGEEKKFTLTFPKEHAQKILAGADIEFSVKLKEVYHLETPSIDDPFAVSLGQKDLSALKEVLRENIQKEKEREEQMREEREMLELIAKKSQFNDIPDLLVNEEVQKMISELQNSVEQQGLNFDTYLANLKKSLADIKLDFTPQALTRIKVALIMKKIGQVENIAIEEKELDEEIDRIAEAYAENEEIRKQIYSPHYRDYTEQILKNRKVIELLKVLMVK